MHSGRRERHKRILVTGSTGFIGKVVVDKLLKRGESVIGFSRSQNQNILNSMQLNEALASCDRIIHLAAIVSFKASDGMMVERTNVIGTLNVMMAAEARAIEKVVLASSAITIGVSSDPTLHFNESWMNNAKMAKDNPYCSSKIKCESMVMMGPVPTAIVNPTSVNVFLFFERAAQDYFLIAPPGGTNIVDVSDVADGIIAALDKGRHGQRYILSNVNITYENLYRRIIEEMGQHKKILVLPKRSMGFCKLLARSSKDAFTSPFTVGNSFYYKYYSNDKARIELGWEPKIGLEEMIKNGYNGYSRSQ